MIGWEAKADGEIKLWKFMISWEKKMWRSCYILGYFNFGTKSVALKYVQHGTHQSFRLSICVISWCII